MDWMIYALVLGLFASCFESFTGVPVHVAARKQEGVDLTCNGDSMSIRLHMRQLLPPSVSSDSVSIHLIDPACRVEDTSMETVTIAISYTDCETERKVRHTRVEYTNTVFIEYSAEETTKILVQCEMLRRDFTVGSMTSSFDALASSVADDASNDTLSANKVGYGAFYVTMQRYKDATFDDVFPVGDSGSGLTLDEDLFFGVELQNVADLRLNLESCWATLDTSANSEPSYEFISMGCGTDSTVAFYESSLPESMYFSFRSFAFIGYSSPIQLHCQVYLCDVTDDSSDCIPSCTSDSSRRRRSVESASGEETVITRDIRSYMSTIISHYYSTFNQR